MGGGVFYGTDDGGVWRDISRVKAIMPQTSGRVSSDHYAFNLLTGITRVHPDRFCLR